MHEESQENENDAENTNRENRRIASTAVWSFGGAQFQLFWKVTAYEMMELKRNLSLAAHLSARKTYLQRQMRHLQACRVHGFPDSFVLFNLICSEVDILILYLSSEIRETMNKVLSFIALVPLNRFCFLAAAILFPAFQPGLKFCFDYMTIFQIF